MRHAVTFVGGAVVGAFLLFIVLGPPEVGTPSPSFAPSQAESSDAVSAARVTELEKQLEELLALPVAAKVPDPDPDVPESEEEANADEETAQQATGGELSLAALLEAFEERQGKRLAALISRALDMGEEGHPLLAEFFEAVGAEKPGTFALREASLALPLLRLVFEREEEVAAFAEYLLARVASGDESSPIAAKIAQEMGGYLADFVSQDPERFPQLRRLLEDSLAASLENPGNHLWNTVKSLRALGLEPSEAALEGLLRDPEQRRYHQLAINTLAQANTPDAVASLRRYIEQDNADARKHWSLRQALMALGRMTDRSAAAAVDTYLQAADPALRESAALAYFSQKRDLNSLPLALEMLNAGEDMSRKRSLLWQLRSSNQEILEAIHADPGTIQSSQVQQMVEQVYNGKNYRVLGASPSGVQAFGSAGGGITILTEPGSSTAIIEKALKAQTQATRQSTNPKKQ